MEQELKKLFIRKLRPRLRVLDLQRQQVLIHCAFSMAGVFALFFLMNSTKYSAPLALHWYVLAGIMILAGIWNGYKAYGKTKVYKRNYKQLIVKELFHFVDPNLTYHHERYISQITYRESELFLTGVDRYRGDDYCEGKLGQTEFEFCDLHTEYKTEYRDSKGRRRTQWHTIFRGIFFYADFHKHFKSETFVLPDSAESTFGSLIGKFFQKHNFSRDQLVQMEDPEFESHFVVYSNDQTDARYVLTPDMMKRILAIYKTRKRKIHLAFKGTRVYVAISSPNGHFEPRIFSGGVNFRDILDAHTVITSTLGLIEDLNLNTRIWTKD